MTYIKPNLFNISTDELSEEKYTTKITAPQYEPRGEMPSVYSLCDVRKYQTLVQEIMNSNISDEDKEFLKLAATRHIVFDYAKIAEYYCHASTELQELMEKSALVIIDVDNAIRNGYVKLDEKITKLAKEAWEERLRTKGK